MRYFILRFELTYRVLCIFMIVCCNLLYRSNGMGGMGLVKEWYLSANL